METIKYDKLPLPSLSILNERLEYNPVTGVFRWKIDIRFTTIKKGDIAGNKHKSNKNVYLQIGILGRQDAANRLAYYMYYKIDPFHLDVHHKNNNTLDNRIDNLELLTLEENNKYKTKYKNNKSGHTGIRKTPEGRFRATIYDKGKSINVGTFTTEQQAIQARKTYFKNNDKQS